MAFILQTPRELLVAAAAASKQSRLTANFTQEELAKRSGVSLGSVKRFERTGQIAFESLIKIAFVLNAVDGIKNLFQESLSERPTLKEILREPCMRKRARAKKSRDK